jgi:hypothetical protein
MGGGNPSRQPPASIDRVESDGMLGGPQIFGCTFTWFGGTPPTFVRFEKFEVVWKKLDKYLGN